MRRRPVAAVVVAAMALLLGGCGGDSGGEEADPPASEAASSAAASDGTTTTSAPDGATATSAGGGGGGGTTASTTAAAGAGSSGATTSTTRARPPEGAYKVTVTLGKACVNPGEVQTVKVKSKPRAVTTYVLEYSDQRNHSNSNGGVANGDGEYKDTFVVNNKAPKGKAHVLATTSTQKEGASFGEASFIVGC